MNSKKEIVNRSWAMDVNERMLYFIEFEDGSAQQKLLNYSSPESPVPRKLLYEINYEAGSEDAELCILAARAKSRITNEVFPTHP